MLSKAKIKLINQLADKKFRKENNCFAIEGNKIILELLKSNFTLIELYCNIDFFEENRNKLSSILNKIHVVENIELRKIQQNVSPQDAVAIVDLPNTLSMPALENNWAIALDQVQDPGNLGTIIRIADWYRIPYIICSPNCADVFNPKVVNASMGGIFRVQVFYTDLQKYFSQVAGKPIYAALLNGATITKNKIYKPGVILLGNESKGISQDLLPSVTEAVSIKKFGGAESLNVAIAAGIICDNFINQ